MNKKEKNQIKLIQVTPQDEDLHMLITKLDKYLLEQYPVEEVFVVDFTDVAKVNDMVFIVAYLDHIPVGCGAIRQLDERSTELKRFFVDEPYRNRGIAKMILEELESRAKALHFKTIKLEAGEEQPEAICFYKKNGYLLIEKFGEYVNSESSVCYEKHIAE